MFPSRIFLVGLSGGGKSTVGRLVARSLGWDFVDSDDEIERTAGRPVPEIFEQEGEAKFRERETEVLRWLAAREPIVVATGGGAPTTPGSGPSIARASASTASSDPRATTRLCGGVRSAAPTTVPACSTSQSADSG